MLNILIYSVITQWWSIKEDYHVGFNFLIYQNISKSTHAVLYYSISSFENVWYKVKVFMPYNVKLEIKFLFIYLFIEKLF